MQKGANVNPFLCYHQFVNFKIISSLGIWLANFQLFTLRRKLSTLILALQKQSNTNLLVLTCILLTRGVIYRMSNALWLWYEDDINLLAKTKNQTNQFCVTILLIKAGRAKLGVVYAKFRLVVRLSQSYTMSTTTFCQEQCWFLASLIMRLAWGVKWKVCVVFWTQYFIPWFWHCTILCTWQTPIFTYRIYKSVSRTTCINFAE